MHCRPKSPNATRLPRVASPFIRPRWTLRNFVRLGISDIATLLRSLRTGGTAAGALGARRRAGRRAEVDHLAALDVALVDPDLDADDAVGRLRDRGAVVEVRLQP